METIKLTIDGREIETRKGKSVLEASLEGGIYIPHLCHHADLSPIGACRLCVVEIESVDGVVTSCTTPAGNGMVVRTKSEKIDQVRRLSMELMLAGHPPDCSTCVKYLNCELQSIKQYLASDSISVRRRSRLFPAVSTNPLFLSDPNRCILCGRCVRACHELRGAGVLFYRKKGKDYYIGTAEDLPLAESGCRFCGACAEVCPTGAIMDKEELTKGKNRKTALIPCRFTCPAEIDVPRYIRFIREGNYAAAASVIREKVPFPVVLGYVCNHECESVCRRGEVNQAVSIRNLKRYAALSDTERLWEKNRTKKPDTGRKVAIIGSGPAGLTAAYYLCKQGHTVTVFESYSAAGGMLRYGIPEYRLPREALDSEIRDIEDMGVEIRTDTPVDSIDDLISEGYEAVLVAVGAHKGIKLPIAGAGSKDVLINTDFLRDVNLGKDVKVGRKVVVLGGGNVAFDCARVARRLGAETVLMACLESRETMPAACDEIEEGEAEGITIYPSRTFTKILSEDGRVKGVECLEVASFGFDEDKNLEIETIDGSQHVLEGDMVIFAVGQKPVIPFGFGLDTTVSGLVDLDPYTLTTNRDEVFAAGDAVTGTASVIRAIASGRKAAITIDKYFGGRGDIDEKLAPLSKPVTYLGPGRGFAALSRCEEAYLLPKERIRSFCKIAEDMDEKSALSEANRCLQCDLRLTITPVKFWGSY